MINKQIKTMASRSKFILLLRLLPIVVLMLTGQNILAQSVTVRGIVKDATGETIVGASVVEKGTTNGVTTNVNGEFSLTVQQDAVIQITFIGFAMQEISASDGVYFDIALAEDVIQIGEVVVVGYGVQKKESVVGAISQLNTGEILQSPAANISHAISGKMAGVFTSQTSGAPGADDVEIFIRGRATFAGDAQPLVLVDGIERPFSQLAPDDIETISVLKDASATAVYGVRGANGVMLITTKRGKEQKPEVNLTANFQFKSPTRRDTYLNSYQSLVLLDEALQNDGLPLQYDAAAMEMYRKSSAGELRSGLDALLYPDVNWYNEVLKKSAPAQRYNINIRGGTRRMRYYASGEVYNENSMVKNLSLDTYGNSTSPHFVRYAFRANTDFFLTKDLTLSVNFATRFEERSGPNSNESPGSSEIFYELNHTPGWLFPVAYQVQNGEETRDLYGGSSQYQNNIVGRLSGAGYYRENRVINETNFIMDYKMDRLTEGLSAKGMVSFDYDNMHRNLYTAGFATYELNDRDNYQMADAYNRFNSDTPLDHSSSFAVIYKLYMEAQLNYARRFGLHDVTAMALYNQNDYRRQAELAQRYQGVVGRITYGYDDRYLAEFNVGYNGSENFVKGKRFGFFPSFSVGWRISNEDFMSGTKSYLHNLKIRGSYGQVGNDVYQIGSERQRFLYEQRWLQLSNAYRFGSTGITGIYESQYPNYDVTWERAHKYNIGVEFGFLRKLNGNFDYFHEKRNDILTEYLTRPQWVGVHMAAGNLGTVKNSGFELELKWNDRIGNDIRYHIGFMFSHARNEILDMNEPDIMTDYRKSEGHPINQYFGLISEGFVTQADLDRDDFPVSTFGNVKVGDLKYRDRNKDGFIDERDITFIGYSDLPENMYSFTLGLDYRNWSFNAMFQGVSAVSRFYDAEAQFAFFDGGKVKEHHQKRWDPAKSEADNLANAKYPLLHYAGAGDHNQRANSFFLQNGAFLRLKNIELSYTLPTEWSGKAGMSECRFYVNANNLITWDKLNGLTDPESNGSNRYPIMKTVNFGVNIKF